MYLGNFHHVFDVTGKYSSSVGSTVSTDSTDT